MRTLMMFCCALVLASAPAIAVPSFFDDFEGGVSGSVWTKWGGASQELLQTSSSHNHTLGGSQSALAVEADPTAYNAYADFGSTSGAVWAEVWVFEDFNDPGTNPARPVTNMLCLIGDTGGAVGFGADYLQLGVVPFWPGGSTTYGWRSAYGDANQGGSQSVGISRKAGWTKLAIQADEGVGAQVRFYIDDVLVGTTQRMAANLRWVRLGNNSKSYENFWYDDVRVVPEPAAAMMLGLGGLLLRRRRHA